MLGELTRKLTRRVAEAYRRGIPAHVQGMEVRRGLDARVLDTRVPAPTALERARAAVEKGTEIVHSTASTRKDMELASARAFRARL